MTYTEQIIKITSEIKTVAERIAELEKEREEWTNRNRGKRFYIGGKSCKVFQQDGTVDPRIECVQREAIRLYDAEIFKAKGLIEGLRYKLVRAAKNGARNEQAHTRPWVVGRGATVYGADGYEIADAAPATINLFGLLHRCGTCTVSSRRSIDVQASAMLVWKSAGGSSPPTVHHIRFATVVGKPNNDPIDPPCLLQTNP